MFEIIFNNELVKPVFSICQKMKFNITKIRLKVINLSIKFQTKCEDANFLRRIFLIIGINRKYIHRFKYVDH
jgi:hypothetical protein